MTDTRTLDLDALATIAPEARPIAELRWRYDFRFGTLQFAVTNGTQGYDFVVGLAEFMKVAGVSPEELRAFAQEMVVPISRTDDIDQYRYDLIGKLPLSGKTVLDVGGYDGRYAAAALKIGASRAICLDNRQFEHYYEKDRPIHDGVEYIDADLMRWTEPVDYVLFFNVLYHIRNPWAALDHLRTITKVEMVLASLIRYNDKPWVYIYEPLECNGSDETVYWGFSLPALERLLKHTGWLYDLGAVRLDRAVYRCWPKPGFVKSHEDT